MFKSDDVSSESVPSGLFDAEILPTASLEEYPRSEQPDRAGSIRDRSGLIPANVLHSERGKSLEIASHINIFFPANNRVNLLRAK